MDLQGENNSELNLAEDSRRQQRKGKGMKSSILHTEQQMSSVEIEFPNASEDLQGNDKDHCTDSPSPPEKLIAGILGVICFILMYILARMALSYSCSHCPPEWFTQSNNCYYVSTEDRTWTESLKACVSENSSLAYTDNEEERKFLSSLSFVSSWIGIFRRSSDHPWMLINGSTPTLEIAESSSGNRNCVILYKYGLASSSCESSKHYICKQRFYS
ncbi:LOW QUALITY PROTEIN: NKG2-A/NKG2-B type II integral membrane protein-like [Phyllostomus discolor]|uniref:LOW QUALITY PROTEIN: NKG2-A/NKG2-B type II integral membrane protein-like n=1 Tax=Phyllostomus discolor TaxID=89673 RepID=A0A7E6D0K4_9CHIR|nr:LOW QUALITY PROTEIN: NKG2-A/NKG2-B type II integral membrane protein-like [Phyllostomus discolor]